MWKRSHRARQGHPPRLFLETLEERRLLAHGLHGGLTPLLRMPPSHQAAIVKPAHADKGQGGPDGGRHGHAGDGEKAAHADTHGHDKPKPPDPGHGADHPDVPPGHAKGHDEDKDETGPGPAQTGMSDPDPQTTAPSQANGGSRQTTPVEPNRAASPVALQPPGVEASRTRNPAVPADDTGGPPPVRPEGTEVDGEGVWAAQPQPIDGDADPNEVARPDAQNTAPRAAMLPRAGPGGASLRAPADAAVGPVQGAGWLGPVAGGLLGEVVSEIGGVLVEGGLESLEGLPGGTLTLSQGEDLVSQFVPFDPQALEAGLRQLVGQLEVAGRQLADLPPSGWVLAAAALATAGELLRRRRAQAESLAANERRDAFRWFPDVGHTEEDA
jgi:hypothetical protein